jgi:hypothetical protein
LTTTEAESLIVEPVPTNTGLSYPLIGMIVLVPILGVVYWLKVDRGVFGRMMGRNEKGAAYGKVSQ